MLVSFNFFLVPLKAFQKIQIHSSIYFNKTNKILELKCIRLTRSPFSDTSFVDILISLKFSELIRYKLILSKFLIILYYVK